MANHPLLDLICSHVGVFGFCVWVFMYLFRFSIRKKSCDTDLLAEILSARFV